MKKIKEKNLCNRLGDIGMDEIRKYMLEFGYNDEDINKICDNYSLSSFRIDTLYDKIKKNSLFLLSLGYSKQDVIKMTKLLPALFGLSVENIKQRLDDLISLGYGRQDVIKMTKLLPSLFGYSIENIKQKLDNLIELGYGRQDVIKMTKSFPSLLNYSIETIKQKLDDLVKLGYSRQDVIKMTKSFPSLLNYSIETIKQKLDDLVKLGYSRQDVIKMTKTFPSLLGLSIENVKKKIDFYGDIGIGNVFINDTKNLMQSVELSYARYYFLYDKGIVIDESNYRKLFYNNKTFEKQFEVSKDYLLEKYPCEERKMKDGRTI